MNQSATKHADPRESDATLTFLNGRVTLHSGDCADVIRTLPDASIDSVVTDPPYEIGFMGKCWDASGIAFQCETWREVLRVLKPGGHILAFGGTRTYHRLACAIEDAGAEIRDCVQWLYGSGFPKSLDVSKAIDKAAGAEPVVLGPDEYRRARANRGTTSDIQPSYDKPRVAQAEANITAPATDAARQWQGWGTALKPACEMIVMARRPLIGTVAANVQQYGTGALNIDGCRVEADWANDPSKRGLGYGFTKRGDNTDGMFAPGPRTEYDITKGRWPANVLHDGSDEVLAAFAAFGEKPTGNLNRVNGSGEGYGFNGRDGIGHKGDTGTAARFFYTAKADSDDRIGSKHPTVKPVDLIQYLVRLVTPPGGTVLDPFAGTGTTGEAAYREGFRAVLIEREDEYCADIARRMELVLAGPDTKQHAIVKACGKAQDAGPLFQGLEAAE